MINPKCLLLALVLVASTQAQTSVDISKINVEVSKKITAQEADASYRALNSNLEEIMNGWNAKRLPSCKEGERSTSCYYGRYFPLSNISRHWSACSQGIPSFAWMPPAETRGGIESLNTWKLRAARGEVFDCRGPDCKVIVHAISASPQETVLAECDIAKIANTYGAPARCMPVALITKERTWVSVIYGIDEVHCRIGTPRLNLLVVYPVNLGPAPLHNALLRAFTDAPLSYSVESSDSKIIGTASYRVSPVLSPYREMVTARIDSRHEGSGNPGYLGLRISIDLYVNRYNTTNPHDWHQPDNQQEDAYEAALKDRIKSSMQHACRKFFWKGSSILLCELPENTPVPDLLGFYVE